MRYAGLPDDLELHHIIVNDWKRGVSAEQNVVLVSIASVRKASMSVLFGMGLPAWQPPSAAVCSCTDNQHQQLLLL